MIKFVLVVKMVVEGKEVVKAFSGLALLSEYRKNNNAKIVSACKLNINE